MQANDIMTTIVVTAKPDTGVWEIVELMLEHRLSAIPITDAENHIVGIISEGDLIQRAEDDGMHHRSWSLEAIFSTTDKARDYIKTHGRTAADIMTRQVVTVTTATPLHKIAQIFVKRHLNCIPVVSDGKLAGVVSRTDVLNILADKFSKVSNIQMLDDETIRETLQRELKDEVGLNMGVIGVDVENGEVELRGIVSSAKQKKAAEVAAENTPGAKTIRNRLTELPTWVWAA